MLKVLFAGFVTALLCTSVFAQDGIYGSAILGQKFVNMDPLNEVLLDNNVLISGDKIPNMHWTVGGEGHVIGAKRWVLGGKGYAFWHNRTFDSTSAQPYKSYLNVIGGAGMGTLGFCIINAGGIHLYPQVGVGISSFIIKYKNELADTTPATSEKTFISALGNDHMQIIQKSGVITDACLAFDWYLKFASLFGLGGGPMIHAEVGTTWDPVKLKWMRDIDPLTDGPDLRFFNPYWNVGIGFGFNVERQ
ncbi:MAG: hypothetical protein V1913_10350 [Fibrobacterota bacterium]